jgi:hypothetical protein
MFEIRLYKDTFTNVYAIKNLDVKPMNSMNTFPLANRNWASMVSYKLPVGYVVSLVADTVILGTTFTGSDYDIENQLRFTQSIELIGTGKTETKTLDSAMKYTSNAWCMYQYDISLGYVEAFTDINYGGNRSVFFPSRYSFNTLIPFKAQTFAWYVNDKIKSIRWNALDTPVYFVFTRNSDGGGASFYDVNGRLTSKSGTKSVADLSLYEGISATISAFKWNMATPLSISSAIGNVPGSSVFLQKSLSKTVYVTVAPSASADVSVQLDQSWTKRTSVTKTTSTTNAWSYSVSLEQSGSYGAYSASLTVSMSQSHESTTENSKTQETEETVGVSESHTVTLNEPGRYSVSAIIGIMDVDPITVNFAVTKTYDFYVARSIQDESGHWKRNEVIPLAIAGSLRSDSELIVTKLDDTPIR